MVLLRKIKSQLARASAFLIAVTLAFFKFQTSLSYGGGRQFSSLTGNELLDGGNWHVRKNEHYF